MIHTWQKLMDFLFPPSASTLIIRQHTHRVITDDYHEIHIHGCIALSSYHSPFIHACITAGKFEGNLEALWRLSPLLAHFIEAHAIPLGTTIFVPIPLHASRERERGYNQIHEIFKPLQKSHTIQVVPLLKRTRATKTQSHQKRAERMTNIRGAFTYQPHKQAIEPTHIIIVDDVLTTGSTLEAARATLAPYVPPGAQVLLVAIAH